MNKLIFTKINFNFNEINKYFLTIIIFILSFFVLTCLLSLGGIDFASSFKLSILTLMNTVNSSIYGLEDFSFNDLHFFSKFCLIFFMIVGRIELLTILLLLKKFLFKSQVIIVYVVSIKLRPQLSWIEHRFSKPRVGGSNPPGRAIFKRFFRIFFNKFNLT